MQRKEDPKQEKASAQHLDDSFQKMYSKELDLDEDEVPIILHELNDSAVHFITREQYERSLSLLQKAQTLLDRLQFQKNPKDRFLVQVTMHNMALCFQKMGALEECALCLDACLHQINSQYLLPKFTGSAPRKLKKLKYECKIHMQVCALLSQLHRHQEALFHAKRSVQIAQYLMQDLLSLTKVYYKKSIVAKRKEQQMHEQEQEQLSDESRQDLIYYDDSISMLERTAYRVYPIIKDICAKMVTSKPAKPQDVHDSTDSLDYKQVNMKVLLGYLNQSEWLHLLNIGNIMQITPLTIHDLYQEQQIDVEFSRDSMLEKISFLTISFFCVSTELRFLVNSKDKLAINVQQIKAESEFWHGKALEVACGFLPSESPLVTHILQSYQKHHAPVQQSIPEDGQSTNAALRVVRPVKGIEKCQFQPLIKQNQHQNIVLSPLSTSPCNYREPPKIVANDVIVGSCRSESRDSSFSQPIQTIEASLIEPRSAQQVKQPEVKQIPLEVHKQDKEVIRVLTPTPGSGEQKMTKDNEALNTETQQQQRKLERNFQSEQPNHDDSLDMPQRQRENTSASTKDLRFSEEHARRRSGSKGKTKPSIKQKTSTPLISAIVPVPPQSVPNTSSHQTGQLKVQTPSAHSMAATRRNINDQEKSVEVLPVPQYRPASSLISKEIRPDSRGGSKRGQIDSQIQQRSTSAGRRSQTNRQITPGTHSSLISNFKTVPQQLRGVRGTTPNTNSNSPRKSSSNKSHVLSTALQQQQLSKQSQNSVSMMVLQKLDNSLLGQGSTLTKEQVSVQMAKTGGFAQKKQKNNKVLTAYLAEKNIEDNDRRQLLIKQALDNNSKVAKDRRKSANAGSKHPQDLQASNSVLQIRGPLVRQVTPPSTETDKALALQQMFTQIASKQPKPLHSSSALIKKFIQERQQQQSASPDSYSIQTTKQTKYIRGVKQQGSKQREPTPVYTTVQSQADNTYLTDQQPMRQNLLATGAPKQKTQTIVSLQLSASASTLQPKPKSKKQKVQSFN